MHVYSCGDTHTEENEILTAFFSPDLPKHHVKVFNLALELPLHLNFIFVENY